MVPVSLKVDTKALFLSNAKEAVAKAKPDDWQTPLAAARYLYDNKYALDDAAKWLDKSIATKATFGNLTTKANALAAETPLAMSASASFAPPARSALPVAK